MSILWVKAGYLHPLNTGGRKRSHAMLRQIQRQHEVTFLALVPGDVAPGDDDRNDDYAAQKIFVPWRTAQRSAGSLALEAVNNLLFSTLPLSLERYRCDDLAKAIREQCSAGEFDLVICDFLTPATAFEGLELEVPVVLFQHNVESDIWRRLAESKRNPLARLYFADQYRRMQRSEQKLSQQLDGIITVSPEDSATFRDRFGLVNVLGDVPTGVDGDQLEPDSNITPARPPRIAFLGSMDWMPNIDAVRWFADAILPAIRRQIPDAEFHIIGRSPTASVRRLADEHEGIVVTGTVADVQPLLQACTLMVVPLLAGGGTRIKILEAMAMGVPVVSTRIGAEGLPFVDDNDILLADQADEFAAAVVRLLREPDSAARLATAARAKVVAEHSWSTVSDRFVELCAPLIDTARRSA